jgi:uncharacterized protein YqgC (DUF456 family)
VLTVFAHVFEFAGTYFGAKWTGASAAGKWGAYLGGLLGPVALIFVPIPGTFWDGLFAGPFVGAHIGEICFNSAARRDTATGVKVGTAAAFANLTAFFVKLFVALLLLGWVGALVVANIIANIFGN